MITYSPLVYRAVVHIEYPRKPHTTKEFAVFSTLAKAFLTAHFFSGTKYRYQRVAWSATFKLILEAIRHTILWKQSM